MTGPYDYFNGYCVCVIPSTGNKVMLNGVQVLFNTQIVTLNGN